MRILHYSLGLPPYRSGGLTKYATDLMKEQVRLGYQVYLLYSGGISACGKTKIKQRHNVDGIVPYEIINSMPVPLYHGIKNPSDFISDKNNKRLFSEFVDQIKPDIIHVHTLMGLEKDLLIVAKERKIKIVFTTHDFYGLCMRCTFIDIKDKLCDAPTSLRCAWCNQNAKGKAFLRFRNEPFVIKLKNKLHKSYSAPLNKDSEIIDIEDFKSLENDYKRLIGYYKDIFGLIDKFHFNSSVTETIYKKYLGNIDGEVVPITNASIRDNRSKGFTCGNTLKMIFVGHTYAFKGFPLLKSVLLELQQYDWRLEVWGGNEGNDPDSKKIVYKGRYTKEDLPKIYCNCTMAIVPSQWYETFSFVTLEALSYGVPALVSDHVGAKTIVSEYAPSFIYSSREELKERLESIMKDRSSVLTYHKKILNMPWHHDMSEHCQEITKKIYNQ